MVKEREDSSIPVCSATREPTAGASGCGKSAYRNSSCGLAADDNTEVLPGMMVLEGCDHGCQAYDQVTGGATEPRSLGAELMSYGPLFEGPACMEIGKLLHSYFFVRIEFVNLGFWCDRSGECMENDRLPIRPIPKYHGGGPNITANNASRSDGF